MNKYYSSLKPGIADIAEGDPLTKLKKHPTQVDVVRFCAAIRNFHRFHYDQAFTSRYGINHIIVPGFLMGNWCIEAVSRSLGPEIEVSSLKIRNTSTAEIAEDYLIEGTVKSRSGSGTILCEMTVRHVASGDIVTTATVGVREQATINKPLE